jgi:NADPH:quinone reductase-like Zn-dependent oxidoreductase
MQTMKAVVHTRYGPPEVAFVTQMPKPRATGRNLLVRVMAATVNRTDAGFRSAEYVVSRLFSGLLRPKYPILGCDFAGIVEEVGPEVTGFAPGDKVFGFNDATFGGHAEYLTISETAALEIIPEGISFEAAAAILEGAHYALCNIRAAGIAPGQRTQFAPGLGTTAGIEPGHKSPIALGQRAQFAPGPGTTAGIEPGHKSPIAPGQRALVYGATGAIGSAAVQLLNYFGVRVTAVCGTPHVDLVKSLGAEIVVDYQTQDFTQTDLRYPFIFDAVGKSSFGACKPLLEDRGIYVSTELGKRGENIWLALLTPLFGGKKVIFPLPDITRADVQFLKARVEDGSFRPLIDRAYPMDDIVEAYRYVESGQKLGNVILNIAD